MNIFRHRGSKAFTLLETAIVIGILSLVLSGGLAMYRVQFVKERMDTTRDRLENIRTALADYKLKNNRLPCPALLTDDYTQASFGNEQPDCADSAAAAGTFRDTATPSGNPARIGAIPVNALGLTPEHMLDSWGRRFVYAVSEKLADDTYSYDSSSYNEAAFGAIRLLPPNGDVTKALGPIPNKTPFVVLSLGKAGDGGYTSAGKLFKTCPDDNAEEENCNFETDATFRTGNFSDSENVADRFDDIVVNNLGNLSNISTDPMLVCGNKGMIYGPTASGADADGCVGGGGGEAGKLVETSDICDNTDPDSVPEGSIRYNAAKKRMELCNGNFWASLGGGCNTGTMDEDIQTFTSSGAWVKPACFGKGATVKARCWGGGGAGGTSWGAYTGNSKYGYSFKRRSGGGGGGAGGYKESNAILMSSILSGSVPVTIGAGGVKVSSMGATGGSGGNSSFGGYITAGGGVGGGGGSSTYGVFGIGGSAGGGNTNVNGKGGDGTYASTSASVGSGGVGMYGIAGGSRGIYVDYNPSMAYQFEGTNGGGGMCTITTTDGP